MNGVPAKAEPRRPGPVVVGGMLFVNSGYCVRRRHAGQRLAGVLRRWPLARPRYTIDPLLDNVLSPGL